MCSEHFIASLAVDENRMKRRLKMVKEFGVMSLLVMTFTLLSGIVLISTASTRNNHQPLDYELRENASCTYVKRFDITKGVWLTVCNKNGTIFLDIRQYVNDTSTAHGIQLDIQQWLTLKQLIPVTDEAVEEARTYWLNLRIIHKGRRDISVHRR